MQICIGNPPPPPSHGGRVAGCCSFAFMLLWDRRNPFFHFLFPPYFALKGSPEKVVRTRKTTAIWFSRSSPPPPLKNSISYWPFWCVSVTTRVRWPFSTVFLYYTAACFTYFLMRNEPHRHNITRRVNMHLSSARRRRQEQEARFSRFFSSSSAPHHHHTFLLWSWETKHMKIALISFTDQVCCYGPFFC